VWGGGWGGGGGGRGGGGGGGGGAPPGAADMWEAVIEAGLIVGSEQAVDHDYCMQTPM
jgi:hypothetical protein